jgi:hypothetical protein
MSYIGNMNRESIYIQSVDSVDLLDSNEVFCKVAVTYRDGSKGVIEGEYEVDYGGDESLKGWGYYDPTTGAACDVVLYGAPSISIAELRRAAKLVFDAYVNPSR